MALESDPLRDAIRRDDCGASTFEPSRLRTTAYKEVASDEGNQSEPAEVDELAHLHGGEPR
jgi:hypothetical protein